MLKCVNESTAAAIYYFYDQFQKSGKMVKEIIVLFKMGGSSTEISITEFNGIEIQVLRSVHEEFLGGEDVDNSIISLVENKLGEKIRSMKTYCFPIIYL